MFYTQMHMVVFQRNADADFCIRPDVSIPSLTTVRKRICNLIKLRAREPSIIVTTAEKS